MVVSNSGRHGIILGTKQYTLHDPCATFQPDRHGLTILQSNESIVDAQLICSGSRQERRSFSYAQIQNWNRSRQVVDYNDWNMGSSESPANVNIDGSNDHAKHALACRHVAVEGSNPYDAPKAQSATECAHSPFTRHPTINFDGLSWPSRYSCRRKTAS